MASQVPVTSYVSAGAFVTMLFRAHHLLLAKRVIPSSHSRLIKKESPNPESSKSDNLIFKETIACVGYTAW
jgi:hypothetical protein